MGPCSSSIFLPLVITTEGVVGGGTLEPLIERRPPSGSIRLYSVSYYLVYVTQKGSEEREGKKVGLEYTERKEILEIYNLYMCTRMRKGKSLIVVAAIAQPLHHARIEIETLLSLPNHPRRFMAY